APNWNRRLDGPVIRRDGHDAAMPATCSSDRNKRRCRIRGVVHRYRLRRRCNRGGRQDQGYSGEDEPTELARHRQKTPSTPTPPQHESQDNGLAIRPKRRRYVAINIATPWHNPPVMEATVEYSVSTWQQPMPPAAGPTRAQVLDRIVEMIDSLGDHRLR